MVPHTGEVQQLELSGLGDQLDRVEDTVGAAGQAGDGGQVGVGEGAGQQSPDVHRALPRHCGGQRDGEEGLRVNLDKQEILSCNNVLSHLGPVPLADLAPGLLLVPHDVLRGEAEAGEDRLHKLHRTLHSAHHEWRATEVGQAGVEAEDDGRRVGRRPLPGAQGRAQLHQLLLQGQLRRCPRQRGVHVHVHLESNMYIPKNNLADSF